MRTIKVLCLMVMLFFTNAYNVSAKSADSAVETQMTDDQAKTFINELYKNAMTAIKSGNDLTVRLQFKKLVDCYFAMLKIAKFVLGKPNCTRLKENEISEFAAALANMQIDVYVAKFKDYAGKNVTFNVKAVKRKKSSISVVSAISVPGKPVVNVTWIISEGSNKVYNVVVDDVSLLNILKDTIRDEMGTNVKEFVKTFTKKHKNANNGNK